LSLTFVIYGIIKRQLSMGPVVSVTAEVLVVAPVAAAFLFFYGTQATAPVGTHALLALAGPLTATPLILFSFAARRLRLSTIGVLQYVNPTLQFACAVLYLGEPFTPWHGIAFPLIWLALAIYTVAQLRQDRASRRAPSSAGTVSTRPM
jgi:chloramphenicol-sensitive protein RarD